MNRSNAINVKKGFLFVVGLIAICIVGSLIFKSGRSNDHIDHLRGDSKKVSLMGFYNNDHTGSEVQTPKPKEDEKAIIQVKADDKSTPEKDERMKAAYVVLVRNKELEGWLNSMRELEDRFNRNYNYPYVFLNEQNFTEEFKMRVKHHTKANVYFGVIPMEHWSIPEWIDESKARDIWKNAGYAYGHSESYRHMCRFESGFFFRHPLLDQFDYYWRVEPDVHFPCDINYDPFKYLHDNDKKYGFTMTYREIRDTIPTLWKTVNDYIKDNNLTETLPKHNAINFLREKEGDDYNTCHFWSNFEIGSLNMWRSKEYLDFFNHLDKKGGFFYERWGDAPVHSIFVSIFLPKSQVHFFKDIGYQHNSDTHCPDGIDFIKNNCHCNPEKSWDFQGNSCIKEWNRALLS